MADKVENVLSIVGKVHKVLAPMSGTTPKGDWIKQGFVIETESEYPKKVPFEAWGDVVKLVSTLKEGTRVKVYFNPEGREYKENWYTTLRVWKIQIDEKSIPSGEAVKAAAPKAKVETVVEEEEDDLPF